MSTIWTVNNIPASVKPHNTALTTPTEIVAHAKALRTQFLAEITDSDMPVSVEFGFRPFDTVPHTARVVNRRDLVGIPMGEAPLVVTFTVLNLHGEPVEEAPSFTEVALPTISGLSWKEHAEELFNMVFTEGPLTQVLDLLSENGYRMFTQTAYTAEFTFDVDRFFRETDGILSAAEQQVYMCNMYQVMEAVEPFRQYDRLVENGANPDSAHMQLLSAVLDMIEVTTVGWLAEMGNIYKPGVVNGKKVS